MTPHSLGRLIDVYQLVHVPALCQKPESLGERRIVSRPDQSSPAQVDQLGIFVGSFPVGGILPPHECPPSYLASHNSALFGYGISPAHGSYGDPEPIRQLSLSGETGSRRQPSGLDVTMERVNQSEVLRLGGLL